MKTKPVTVADLQDQTEMPRPRPVLFCRQCGITSSAHAGDYWHLRPDHVFKCNDCGQPMQLVIRRVTFEPVQT